LPSEPLVGEDKAVKVAWALAISCHSNSLDRFHLLPISLRFSSYSARSISPRANRSPRLSSAVRLHL
jgi:hypothetical protein